MMTLFFPFSRPSDAELEQKQDPFLLFYTSRYAFSVVIVQLDVRTQFNSEHHRNSKIQSSLQHRTTSGIGREMNRKRAFYAI